MNPTQTQSFGDLHSQSILVPDGQIISELTTTPSGRIYTSGYQNSGNGQQVPTIWEVDAVSGNLSVVSAGGLLDSIVSITVEPSGNILVISESWGGGNYPKTLIRINPLTHAQLLLSDSIPQISVLAMPPALNVTRFSQGDPSWGANPYATSAYTIGQKGCALSSLAMALNFSGETTDPGVLNEFLKATPGGFVGSSVNWTIATSKYSSGSAKFVWKKQNSRQDESAARRYLETILCEKRLPIIVGVDLNPSGKREHFVLVTGQDGGDFTIADPGYASRTKLSFYGDFETRGYVESLQSMSIPSPMGPVLADNQPAFTPSYAYFAAPLRDSLSLSLPGGLVLGRQAAASLESLSFDAAYFVDSIANDETGAAPTEGTDFIYLANPPPGAFVANLNAEESGQFSVQVFKGYQDGRSSNLVLPMSVVIPETPATATLPIGVGVDIRRSGVNAVEFLIGSEFGQQAVIQSSTNLTAWGDFKTVGLVDGVATTTEPVSELIPFSFFRLMFPAANSR